MEPKLKRKAIAVEPEDTCKKKSRLEEGVVELNVAYQSADFLEKVTECWRYVVSSYVDGNVYRH